MHVVHFTRLTPGTRTEGGLERAVLCLTEALGQRGVTCNVIGVPNCNSLDTDQQIADCLRGVGTETILHAHDWYAATAVQACYRAGHRRIVATAHLPIRRGFTYLDTDATWQTKAEREALLLEISSRIIAPSEFVRNYLMEEYGVTPDKIVTIAHGVDADRFKPAGQRDPDCTRSRLVFVGRVTEQKGVELLIRALPFVRRSVDATLTIVGSGDRLAACKALAKRLALDRHISFVPHAADHALASIYSQSDLLVMPSLFEPFGLVGLEALACGCPVLAIAPTGASYLVPDDLTYHHSPARLAEAILCKLAQPKPRSENRLRACSYTWANSARETMAVYKAPLR